MRLVTWSLVEVPTLWEPVQVATSEEAGACELSWGALGLLVATTLHSVAVGRGCWLPDCVVTAMRAREDDVRELCRAGVWRRCSGGYGVDRDLVAWFAASYRSSSDRAGW